MAFALQACFNPTALLVRARAGETYSWNVHSKLGGNLLGTFCIDKDKDAYSLLRDLQDQVAKKLRHPTRLPRYLAFYASNVLITPKEWTYVHDFAGKDVSNQASLFVKHLSSTNDLQVMYDEDDQQAITDLSYVSKNPYDKTKLCVKLPAAPSCNTELDMRLLAFNTNKSVTSMDLLCVEADYTYMITDLRVLLGYSSLAELHIQNGLPTSWDVLRFLPNLKVLRLCSTQRFKFKISLLALDHQLTSLGLDITLNVEGYTICNQMPQAIKTVVFCQCELATQDQSFGACMDLTINICLNLLLGDVFSLALEELDVFRTCCSNNIIPCEIGRAVNLRKLSLYASNLVGSIPTEIGRLTKLTYLRLAGNKLTSTIPSQVQNLCNLEVLDLSNNQLEGCIPTNLNRLSKLRELYVYNNRLTGAVPSCLSCLANLNVNNKNFAS
jgi:hypothetical protein